jgi:hypothetical protein
MSTFWQMIGFIHIPKTAGTSIRLAFEAKWPGAGVLVCEANENLFYQPITELRNAEVVFGHMSMALLRAFGIKDYVTVLRNPLERCVSQVQHWCRPEAIHVDFSRNGWDRTLIRPDKTIFWNLESVLESQYGQKFQEISDAACYQLADDRHFRSVAPDEHCLEAALLTLRQSRCFGLVERLNEFVSGLDSALGIQLTVPRENLSLVRSGDIVASLPEVTRRKLASANRLDIELYAAAQEMIGDRGWHQGQIPSNDTQRALGGPGRQRHLDRSLMAHDRRLPGDLALRLSHVLVDIAEFQTNIGIFGDILYQNPIWPRDLQKVRLLAQTGGIIEPIEAIARQDEQPEAARPSEAPGIKGQLRIAVLQARARQSDTENALNEAGSRLHPSGIVLFLNALAPKEIGSLYGLIDGFGRHGLNPLATVDRHMLLTKGTGRALYAALLKAKMNDFEIAPLFYCGMECLEIDSDCA